MTAPRTTGPDVHGRALDGREETGPEETGREVNGPALNGHALDGHEMNGHVLDGERLDGRHPDRRTLDGPVPAPAAAAVLALHETVSLLVPAGRSVETLGPLLAGLVASARRHGMERLPPLVVGLGASLDGAASMAELERAWRQAGGEVEWVRSRAGHATAVRNDAAARVTTEWVAFLDDDVVIDDHYLPTLARLCRDGTADVVQGIPYLCSNAERFLAARESRNYEDGFVTYLETDGTVRIVDARNLLMRTRVARQFPFDESLRFAGEGQELGRRLTRCGIRPRYCDELRVYHRNRATVRELLRQKYYHGRGRAQRLRVEGGLDFAYVRHYARRHYLGPAVEVARGKIALSDAAYRWATNTVFWLGVVHGSLLER